MPKLPLARTYRPQRFAEVLGQQAPVKALGAAAARGDVAAAYIFSGTRGIGKTTIARIFAKTLNCEKGPAADCCDECPQCRGIAEGRELDVLELDAATHTGIDDIRELRDAAKYPPTHARYRVFILDEAHQLSQASWNGLLKILEEPPPWCVFLFCTTEPHKIPQTIESRALHFAFRSPAPAQIRGHLASIAGKEGIEVDDEALDLLVVAADGSVRDGLSALDQARALTEGKITREAVRTALGLVPAEAVDDYVDALGRGDAPAALKIVGELDAEGQDLRAFAGDALERTRRLALVLAAGPAAAPNGEALAKVAASFQLDHLVWLGRVLDETEGRLRQGGAQRALLDLATVRMTRLAGLSNLADLVDTLRAGGAPGGHGGGPGGGGRPIPSPRPSVPSRPAPSGPRASFHAAAQGAADVADDRPAPRGAFSAAGEAPVAAPRASVAVAAGAPAGAGNGELLPRICAVLSEARPSIASLLRNAQSAEVTPSGGLRLALPGSMAALGAQLVRAEDAILSAAREATGVDLLGLETVVAAGASSPADAAANARREAMDLVRKDPVARAVFDQFGAMVMDVQALAPPTQE
ncbi:MAG: DNA polymerase III subunit gamma/tau [Candidatus Polarisedimenticolia bacterium]